MSNRLEQEFPRTSWRAIPPVGPRGLDTALRRSIARGRELRSQAVRKSARGVIVAAARGFVAVAAFVRRPGHDPTERPPERECWGSPAHGA
jgi:hypothetical protein